MSIDNISPPIAQAGSRIKY